MNDQLKHKIYSSTDCIPEQLMFDYIDNKLTAKERHQVEKHLLDCELCSDAMEGIELVKNRKIIAKINTEIDNRISAGTINKETKIIFFNYKTIAAIAAGLLLLIGAALFFNKFTSTDKTTVAETKITSTDIGTDQLPSATDKNIKGLSLEVKTTPPISSSSSVSERNNGDFKKEPAPPVLEVEPDRSGALSTEKYKIDLKSKEVIPELEKSAPADIKVITGQPTPANPVIAKDTTNSDGLKTRQNRSASVKKRSEEKDKINIENRADSTGYGSTDSKSQGVAEYSEINVSVSAINDSVYSIVTEMPVFPGGIDSLLRFIRKQYIFPATSSLEKIPDGTETIVQFIIDTHGSVKKPMIVKGIDSAYDKETIRIVKLIPKWKPGKQNGKIVPVLYRLPIRLQDLKK